VLLSDYGFATGAAVSTYVLRSETGLGDLFHSYDDPFERPGAETIAQLQREGKETLELAMAWIEENAGRPLFFFFHIYEPHTPYDPPEPYASLYGSPYDGEVAEADAIVGDFLERLRRLGLYDQSVVIFLSDHGEGLRDHGEDEHGILLNRESVQVPLILKLPYNHLAGTRVSAPVQLIDVFPTVTHILGIPTPPGLPGQSLLALAIASDPPSRRIFSETLFPRIHFGWSDLRSLVDEDWHYIEGPTPELYDMKADPAQRHNLAEDKPDVVAELQGELDRYGRNLEGPADVSPEEAAHLAALGYVGTAGGLEDTGEILDDPKDHLDTVRLMKRGFDLFGQDRMDEAEKIFVDLLEQNPGLIDVRGQLAEVYRRQGQINKAIAAYRETLNASGPAAGHVAIPLASLHLELGELEEARAVARIGLESSPRQAHELLARIALNENDLETAEREALLALDDPSPRIAPLLVLARVKAKQGQLEEALKLVSRSRAMVEDRGLTGHSNLDMIRGDILARMGRVEEAEEAFLEEIRTFKKNRQAYANLALLYASQGRNREAIQMLQRMTQEAPDARSFYLAARTLEILGDKEGAEALRAEAVRRRG
jgi:tetratricopeptide (TPR) repeat protein